MISYLLEQIAELITRVIEMSGLWGITFLMAIESAGIPAPSEIIMPFAGYLADQGSFSFMAVVLAGAVGNLLGSLVAYGIAYVGGRPFIVRFGRYVLFSEGDLNQAEHFFSRYGQATVFIGRLLPVVRTYISFPAGLAKMPLLSFAVYSFVGSLLWSWLLAAIGRSLGAEWASIRERFHGIDLVVAVFLLIGLIWWIRRHLQHRAA